WFAGSFPVAIFPTVDQSDLLKPPLLKPNPDRLPGYADRLKMTADLFTASQIAVYPINAEGVMTEHANEADSAGPGAPGGIQPRTADTQAKSVMFPSSAEANERTNAIFDMEQLAVSTGGKAFYNGNDLNAELQRAIDDGANYYTIGYSLADRKMDGRYRQIDVRLAHGKVKLAYRHGYIANDTQAADAKSGIDPLSPLLQLGLPDATGVLYGVSAEPSAIQPSSGEAHAGQNPNLKNPVTRYTVNFVIRSQDLLFTSRPQGDRSGKLLLGLKAYDRDGNALNWEAEVETLKIKPDQYDSIRKSGIPVHQTIDLPTTGEIHLVTAVYDLDGGEAGSLEVPLRVTSQAQ
ncbi:MAG TPA: VWA domain-containing protein, partial [Terracidiphilus sp.]|nr:VWA domain-containing protein [Terracidiphilus sp.]